MKLNYYLYKNVSWYIWVYSSIFILSLPALGNMIMMVENCKSLIIPMCIFSDHFGMSMCAPWCRSAPGEPCCQRCCFWCWRCWVPVQLSRGRPWGHQGLHFPPDSTPLHTQRHQDVRQNQSREEKNKTKNHLNITKQFVGNLLHWPCRPLNQWFKLPGKWTAFSK